MSRQTFMGVFCSIILFISAILAGFAYSEYTSFGESEAKLNEIAQEVEEVVEAPRDLVTDGAIEPSMIIEVEEEEVTEENIEVVSEDIEEEETEPIIMTDPLLRRIDFASLMRRNHRANRWLYIPETNVDYPIIQEDSADNFYYLWRDIDGDPNRWGSIMTPPNPYPEVDMASMLVFGHRTNLGAYGFIDLPKYADRGYTDDHKYVYIYYPNRAERWKVWTSANAVGSSEIYRVPYELGSDDYQELLDYIQEIGYFETTDKPSKNRKITVLSTCDRSFRGTEGRYFVALVPDTFYYYDIEQFTRGYELTEEQYRQIEEQRNNPQPENTEAVTEEIDDGGE